MAQIIIGVAVGAAYSLMAVGVALIYKCTRALSIAQGEIGAFGFFFALRWARHGVPGPRWHLPHWSTLIVAVVIGAVIALAFERTVMRALVSRPPLDGLIATLGLALLLALVELKLFGVAPQEAVSPVGKGRVVLFGATLIAPRLVALALAGATAVGIAQFFQRTKFGLAVRATTSDPGVAKLLGVPVNQVYRFAWVVGGVLSGLAAALLAPSFGTLVPFGQTRFALAALAGAVVGGLDSIEGAIVGSILVGVVETLVGFYFDPGWAAVAVLLLVLGALLVRPRGLLGTSGLA